MILNILLVLLGFIFLIKGADFLVDGASNIAEKFKVPEFIIGLTIVSIGTSLPELVVSLTSSLNNHADMAIGNVVGSNISNLFLVLGVCALMRPLKFKEETVRIEIPIVIFLTALLYIFGNNKNEYIITRKEGLILIVLCLLFIIYNIWFVKKRQDEESSIEEKVNIENNLLKFNKDNLVENNKNSLINSILKIIIGIILLKYGGDFIVDNLSIIASIFGISEKIISLTIISISTSLPELITSVTAILKNKADIGIGNIMGSNIFNIVLIIGVTSFVNPIRYSLSYNSDIILFLLGMIVLAIIPFIGEKNKISRISGFSYVFAYVLYISNLVYGSFLL